jgi:hypothetical protein
MMNTTQTQTDPFAVLAAHIASIKPATLAAWRGPVVRNYAAGAVVWMWDHYNTAVVTGPGRRADHWAITTTDADGSTSSYEYPSAQLRPAIAPVEFRW